MSNVSLFMSIGYYACGMVVATYFDPLSWPVTLLAVLGMAVVFYFVLSLPRYVSDKLLVRFWSN